LHDTYTRGAEKNLDEVPRRAVELLLEALIACRPTEESKKKFVALELMESVIKTGRRNLEIRFVVMDALKLFGPGKRRFFGKGNRVTELTFFDD
jgi:hypothetical protein